MASLGEYRPPNQIANDEDKYWKLTKTQLIYVGIGLIVGFLVFSILNMFHIVFLRILGVVLCLMLAICGGFIGGFTIPNSRYLKGGGLRIDVYIRFWFNKRYSKKKKRVLYTQNINRGKDTIPYITEAELEKKEDVQVSLFDMLREMFGGAE